MVDEVQLYVNNFPFPRCAAQTGDLTPYLLITDVLSAGLDSGLAISTIVIFFCLNFPKDGTIGSTNIATWWGNNVFANTADWNATPLWTPPENGTFGPATW